MRSCPSTSLTLLRALHPRVGIGRAHVHGTVQVLRCLARLGYRLVLRYLLRGVAGAGKWMTVSSTLIQKYIGLEEMAQGMSRVYYRGTLLGYLDEKQLRIRDDLGRERRNLKRV